MQRVAGVFSHAQFLKDELANRCFRPLSHLSVSLHCVFVASHGCLCPEALSARHGCVIRQRGGLFQVEFKRGGVGLPSLIKSFMALNLIRHTSAFEKSSLLTVSFLFPASFIASAGCLLSLAAEAWSKRDKRLPANRGQYISNVYTSTATAQDRCGFPARTARQWSA